MNAERCAWNEFWKEQGASGGVCLESAPATLRSALAQHWQEFATGLPVRASLLDLGCGSGAVGRAIGACRLDLRLYGVDYAVVGGVQAGVYASIAAGVPMETLPFETARFRGAVSQFGFEYSSIEVSLAELARVMVPGAPLSLIVHHADSPIVTANRRSLSAYRRLLSPESMQLFIAGHRAGVERIATAAASMSSDPAVELVAQSLRERVASPLSVRKKCWQAINDALKPELALATALDRSAVGPSSLDNWLAPFGDHFDDLSADPLQVGRMPFAWKIQARRREAAPIATIGSAHQRRSTLLTGGR